MTPARTGPRGPRRAQILALATGTGLTAALLAYFGLARQAPGVAIQEECPVAIVVAARDITARRPLTPFLLRVRRVPASQVPAGSVAAPEELAGQVTVTEVAQDQPVTRAMVTPRTASPGLAWAVAPARRAVSVALDPQSGVAGFLEPGDHVDVLATFETGDGQAVTRTILQDARLLALGTRTTPAPPDADGADKPATGATLEVTPGGAQALALAAARGKLQLSLRGPDDAEQLPVPALPSATVTGATVTGAAVGCSMLRPYKPSNPYHQAIEGERRSPPGPQFWGSRAHPSPGHTATHHSHSRDGNNDRNGGRINGTATARHDCSWSGGVAVVRAPDGLQWQHSDRRADAARGRLGRAGL